MKSIRILAISIAVLAIGIGRPCAQTQAPEKPPDLSGTWSGETVTPNGNDVLTLVLAKKGDSYSGTISDTLFMLNQTPLQGLKFEKGVLTFYFIILTPDSEMRVDNTIKLNGSKLAGTWATASGETGTYELERNK